MATYTSHYNLKKPSTTDNVDIADFNENFDLIDAGMYTAKQQGDAAKGMIESSVESSSTAAHAYAEGDYFIYLLRLYRATAAIAVGDTITPNTNCVAVTVGGELVTLSAKSVPSGGSVGQVLTKTSNGIAWQDPQGGGSMPSGGAEGNILIAGADGVADWQPKSALYPSTALYQYHYVLANDGNGGLEWMSFFYDFLPGYDGDGKVLAVMSSTGDLAWVPGLPTADISDAGKVLMVNSSGEWVIAPLP